MSLLARPIRIDLIGHADPSLAMVRRRTGEKSRHDEEERLTDYAARMYIAFDVQDSALSRATRFKFRMARSLFGKGLPDAAVVYVWDNFASVGTARKSSYTDRSQLIVTETGLQPGRHRGFRTSRRRFRLSPGPFLASPVPPHPSRR